MFHEDRCKGEAFMRLKPFYLTTRLQTDGQTDGRTDRVIPVYPPNFVAGGIMIRLITVVLHSIGTFLTQNDQVITGSQYIWYK